MAVHGCMAALLNSKGTALPSVRHNGSVYVVAKTNEPFKVSVSLNETVRKQDIKARIIVNGRSVGFNTWINKGRAIVSAASSRNPQTATKYFKFSTPRDESKTQSDKGAFGQICVEFIRYLPPETNDPQGGGHVPYSYANYENYEPEPSSSSVRPKYAQYADNTESDARMLGDGRGADGYGHDYGFNGPAPYSHEAEQAEQWLDPHQNQGGYDPGYPGYENQVYEGYGNPGYEAQAYEAAPAYEAQAYETQGLENQVQVAYQENGYEQYANQYGYDSAYPAQRYDSNQQYGGSNAGTKRAQGPVAAAIPAIPAALRGSGPRKQWVPVVRSRGPSDNRHQAANQYNKQTRGQSLQRRPNPRQQQQQTRNQPDRNTSTSSQVSSFSSKGRWRPVGNIAKITIFYQTPQKLILYQILVPKTNNRHLELLKRCGYTNLIQ